MIRSATVAAVVALAGAAQGAAAADRVPQPRHPAALVVLVPGSGFHGVGPRKRVRLSIGVDRWRRWGYRTRLVRYRPGRRGLADVRAALSAARRARPRLPLCAYGESSGGTWVLVAAAADPGLDCVVISASPTDQETWAQSDRRGALRLATEVWPGYFGSATEDNMFEPFDVWTGAPPGIPALLLYAQGDQAVPAQQGRLFATVAPGIRLRVLRRGGRMFVHNKVDSRQLGRVRAAARSFVSLAGRWELRG